MKKLVLLTSLLALCACGGGSGGGSGAPLPPSSDVVGPSDTPDSGGGNTGDENIGGGDNTGDDNTGGGNTGDDNTGDDNTGDDNTGDDNTGDDNTGDDNTGDDNTGDDEPDLPVIIAPELFSGNLHMMPKVTDGGEGPTETYYLIADANTGDVVMRTYITECPSDQTCESDSRGFIKNEFLITNINDFTNGVHSNGLTAFLNAADGLGMQYSDIFTSADPAIAEDGLLFFEPMYYDANVVDMKTLAPSLTDNVKYQGKAYGAIRIETAPANPGQNVDAEVTGTLGLASVNKAGNPIGVDATLTFDPNSGNPIETLNADFSAFNWYDTTITAQNGVITDVQLTAKGEIESGFAVDNGGADSIERGEAQIVYSGTDTSAVATEAVGSYHIEWARTDGSNNIDTMLDVAFGGVKQ